MRPNCFSVLADIAFLHVEIDQFASGLAIPQLAAALAIVRVCDLDRRPGEQFRLAVTHELAHGGVGAENAGGSEFDFDLTDAADIEHGAEN